MTTHQEFDRELRKLMTLVKKVERIVKRARRERETSLYRSARAGSGSRFVRRRS